MLAASVLIAACGDDNENSELREILLSPADLGAGWRGKAGEQLDVEVPRDPSGCNGSFESIELSHDASPSRVLQWTVEPNDADVCLRALEALITVSGGVLRAAPEGVKNEALVARDGSPSEVETETFAYLRNEGVLDLLNITVAIADEPRVDAIILAADRKLSSVASRD